MSQRALPEFGLLRLKQILGDPQNESTPAIIPVSKTTWWDGVRAGRFPEPIRIGGVTFWRIDDIRRLCDAPNRAWGRES
jgi:hypothetical protein